MSEETETPRPADAAGRLDGLVRFLPGNPPVDGEYLMFGLTAERVPWLAAMPGYFADGLWFYFNDDEQGLLHLACRTEVTHWAEFPKPNVLLCRAGHGNTRKRGALSPASARAAG